MKMIQLIRKSKILRRENFSRTITIGYVFIFDETPNDRHHRKKNNDIIQEVTTIIPNKAQEDEMFEEKNIELLEHNAEKKELKVA